ncbi:MAG TPA: helix-turn-helix transcriptional regulator [Miltoncostaea sp.]|nr:helix-turn-helix transcriptional regulator [Miltoncostaea sp.]
MLADPAAERARRRIVRLCAGGLDAGGLLRAVAAEVGAVVGYDGAAWVTIDPATLLVTGGHVEELPRESAPAFYENEYLHEDVLSFAGVARAGARVATLYRATGGDPAASRLHRELGPAFGFRGDSLRAAFVRARTCWGAVALARRDPRRPFAEAEISFMASITGAVADGLRAAVLLGAVGGPAAVPGAPPAGVLVLAGAELRSASAGAEAWLDELGGGPGGRLHSALVAVAGAAGAEGDAPARTVVRTPAGRWLAVQAVALRPGGEVALILDAARRPEMAEVVMRAYGLSVRERDVAQRVIAGASTAEVAADLHISPWTVQDHLKSVFDKVGVRSRGELAKQVFDRHYAPSRAR